MYSLDFPQAHNSAASMLRLQVFSLSTKSHQCAIMYRIQLEQGDGLYCYGFDELCRYDAICNPSHMFYFRIIFVAVF